MALVAHPDDAELMFYGTLRCAKEAGAAITIVMASKGERGVAVKDESSSPAGLDGRLDEYAAAVAGAGFGMECFGLPDGRLTSDNFLTTRIERAMRAYKPTSLLTHWPEALNDHQDHLAVGKAAVNCAMRSSDPVDILCGEPLQPGSRFIGNVEVDITRYIEDKCLALAAHASQAGRWYLSRAGTIGRANSWRSYPDLAASGVLVERMQLLRSFI